MCLEMMFKLFETFSILEEINADWDRQSWFGEILEL